MGHNGLVSESVAAALNIELISYVVSRQTLHGEDGPSASPENEVELNTHKDLEGLGLLLGLRLSERLLYRQPSFGEWTPSGVTHFVARTFWKTAFGKKVDRMMHMNDIYFCLIDRSFRWLEGFPKIKGDRTVSTKAVSLSAYAEESVTKDEAASTRDERLGDMPIHKDVLIYTVGILKGLIRVMYPSGPLAIHANINNENETHFVLDFRSTTT
ncbi:uncharacterized protein Tco025E_07327 [Trypanosoma conorhini]|uniref:Transport protein particle (TRAPP) subunit n=1 Tax=Trypanosoma conorhini TaxID=83891 RepID=A0A3S5IRM1_9TRYP|nr:uncharacterized protein Tco025E_07327 [Trypanosoma conorhini]RNF07566.1 hypothetical protein Tco025E_07327 [Trypanosoma conorhini]